MPRTTLALLTILAVAAPVARAGDAMALALAGLTPAAAPAGDPLQQAHLVRAVAAPAAPAYATVCGPAGCRVVAVGAAPAAGDPAASGDAGATSCATVGVAGAEAGGRQARRFAPARRSFGRVLHPFGGGRGGRRGGGGCRSCGG